MMERTMKAVWYETQGPANEVLVLGDTPIPQPGPGDVLVRLHASGCNPSDVKLRAGARPMGFDRIIPHSDGAGVIVATGGGITKDRIGQRVWIWNGQWQRSMGSCAEYIALPETQAVRLPEETGFAEGACLGIPAMTAYRCVTAGGPVEGTSVLVTGGAGTVGRYAIQIAAALGATVTTTVSTPEKAEYARKAGAHHIVNYRDEDAAEAIMDLTGGVDRIVEVEFGANLDITAQIIKPNGVIAAYGSAGDMTPVLPFYPLMFKDVTLRMVLVYLLTESARKASIDGLMALLEAGQLTHSVAENFELAETVEAHQSVERAGKMGSVVVTIPGSPSQP
ncbi:MAG: NADPH:quinone reductase [Paracoccaceae bacterium]|nr:NADPH:quinone reductase [Paracoccaceae bacterium]